mgnify:CR=1 FL=1
MADYQTEDNYIVAENEEGELYIYISAKSSSPINPHIIYDGRDHALLVKNPALTVILDYINPDVRDKMRKTKQLVIVETIMENIKDAYFADMQIVDKLPLNIKDAGLRTWEEVALHKTNR